MPKSPGMAQTGDKTHSPIRARPGHGFHPEFKIHDLGPARATAKFLHGLNSIYVKNDTSVIKIQVQVLFYE